MKKIELVALTQLLGKISSGSISHDERKGLLDTMKVAKYNLEMRDEKMRTAMKKYGIEIDPNTGRIAEGNDKTAVASFLDDMNKVDTSNSSRFFRRPGPMRSGRKTSSPPRSA